MNRPVVLIIEDDAPLRQMVATLLEAHRFAVVTAAGGAEGIERLAERRYSAILLDLLMPEVHGVTVLQYIASWRPAWLRRVIVMTALDPATFSRLPGRNELAAIVSKPFNAMALVNEVQSCVVRNMEEDARTPDPIEAALAEFRTASESRGAIGGVVASARGEWVAPLARFGDVDAILMRNALVPLDAPYAICDVLRGGEAAFTETTAVVPAPRGSAAAWAFATPQTFDDDRRRGFSALAARCAF